MPTWDRHPDYTVLPIGDALKRHEAPSAVLRASYDRTTSVVGRIPHVLEPLPDHLPVVTPALVQALNDWAAAAARCRVG